MSKFPSPLKIAIVHDWLVTYGGAERVLSAIIETFPEADLFSVIDFFSDSDRAYIGGKHSKTTFIQGLPLAKKIYRNYLPLMPLAIEQLDLSGYNLIISSSHAIAKGVITGPNQLHICYCHSPIRYAWDMQSQYLSESNLSRGFKSWLARYMLFKLRDWDYRTANGVDHFIANSHYISKRINKVYRRNSFVINPNVDTSAFPLHENKEDFYLTASRLVPYKRIDMIARAFAQMPDKRLIIIGDGPQAEKIRKISSPNIEFLGFQPFEVLRDYMSRAKAFVFAAEEDFGIIPVEAQSCGTPVIAFRAGGALETIVEHKTGIFFNHQSEASIIDAITDFEKNFKFEPKKISAHAENFSTIKFKENLKKFIVKRYMEFAPKAPLPFDKNNTAQ